MNEHIKKLVIEAAFDENTSMPSDKMYTFTEEKMSKFAELIVKECADIADFCNQVESTETVSSVLTRHFEVKE